MLQKETAVVVLLLLLFRRKRYYQQQKLWQQRQKRNNARCSSSSACTEWNSVCFSSLLKWWEKEADGERENVLCRYVQVNVKIVSLRQWQFYDTRTLNNSTKPQTNARKKKLVVHFFCFFTLFSLDSCFFFFFFEDWKTPDLLSFFRHTNFPLFLSLK